MAYEVVSMKRVRSTELKANLDAALDAAQCERIVISRGGKPCAVLVGIEGYDAEDLRLAGSEAFWQMIHQRRSQGRSMTLAEVEARVEQRAAKRAKKKNGPKNRRDGA